MTRKLIASFLLASLIALCPLAHAQRLAKTVWEYTTGGATDSRYSASVTLPSGEVVLLGEKEDAGGNMDLWARRFDPDGNVVWSQTHNKPGTAGSLFVDQAQLDPNGDIVVLCRATGNATTYDTVILKLDQNGVKLDDTTLDLYDWDLASGMDVGNAGNIVFSSRSTDPGQYQVTKLDPSLNVLWTTYLGNVGQDMQVPTGPKIIPGGEILVGGVVNDGTQQDVRIHRLSTGGTVLAERTLGDSTLRDGSPCVFVSEAGNTYFGFTRREFEPDQEVRLLQIDSALATVWSLEDPDIVSLFVAQLPGGDLVVNGPTFPSLGVVGQKFARVTETGTVVWANDLTLQGFEHNYTRRLLVGTDGYVYSTAHGTPTGYLGTTWVVHCLNQDGALVYKWALPSASDQYNFPLALAPLNAGSALVAGETGTATEDDATVLRLAPEFNVFPLAFAVRLGRQTGGNLASLVANDNNFMEVCRYIVPNLSVLPVNIEFESFVPADYPTNSLDFRVVSKAGSPGLQQVVELWNWVTGQWERTTVQNMALTEQELVVPASLAENIQAGTRFVRARLRVAVTGIVLSNSWCVQLDQATWTARP